MTLPSQLQQYVHLSRYARWDDNKNRRETWDETVDRYVGFFHSRFPEIFPAERVARAIKNLEVMPSMRAVMTAGRALELDEMAGYNCSFAALDHQRSFDEILYVLMCGTGVGFSVERRFIENLPTVPDNLTPSNITIVVEDSKIGWASAFREMLESLWRGYIPKWNLTNIRPEGARLKTFGGRASGPKPLDDLLNFTVKLFWAARGRPLTSLECHDLTCKIADVVVVGGVRRSALISLSDLGDEEMRSAKSGEWYLNEKQRALANNSAVYHGQPARELFDREWATLRDSGSGERGIFNLHAAQAQAGLTGRRNHELVVGTNPCGEIGLRNNGLCNLSEVIVRADDDYERLKEKVELASILGTFQSTLTGFRYVRPVWRQNAEEERLLGVSMTGIMDNVLLNGIVGHQATASALDGLRDHAQHVNFTWAHRLGINRSAAITTVKPSGTVSQLVDSASGIHPRYSPYYVRTVRADKKDPLARFMRDKGFPVEDCVMKPNSTDVFSFPVEAPQDSIMRTDMSAIQQLEHYLVFKKYWCEHNPSITIYIRPHEWLVVGDWVYDHLNDIGGVSFLPYSDHVYQQAPYTEISREDYEHLAARMPEVQWDELSLFEKEDSTNGTQTLSCSAGVCEIL